MLSMMELLSYHLTLSIYSSTLYIIKSKLYRSELSKVTKKLPDNLCYAHPSNNGIELINLPSISNNTNVTSSTDSSINFSSQTFLYNLPKPKQSTIF